MMGATKRAAELAVFTVGRDCGLPCAVVRFGNVIGSRGSVVPTFLRQILDGGPVTLTDPDMKRYFMTIPEAVSLVLQAGSMADEGKIFLLDMGEPASILDMARQMIRMSRVATGRGHRDQDHRLSSWRAPHREVHDDNETIGPTSHPSISSVTPRADFEPEELVDSLRMLERTCAEANGVASIRLLERLLQSCGVGCELALDLPPTAPEYERVARPVTGDAAAVSDLDRVRG